MGDTIYQSLDGAEPRCASRLAITLRALKHRNFQLFFGGQFISLIGTWMQMVAESWLVYRLTGSSFLLGSIGFVSQLPILLLVPFGGMLADRCHRHRIVIGTQTASMFLAFILAWLTLSGHVQVWHVFVLGAGLGVVNAFDFPARQAFIIDMVGKEDLMNAIVLQASMFNGARIIGPAVAGVLVASMGEGWCFFANAASYLAVIAGLLLMKMGRFSPVTLDEPPLQHLIGGFRFVRTARPARALLLLLGVVSLVGVPYSVLMPIFAGEILHSGARGFGLLMCSSGIGALLAGLSLASRGGLKGLTRMVAFASAAFAGSLILFSQSRHLWLSILFLLPLGYFMMTHFAASQTLVLSMTPDRLRGRVMAVFAMLSNGMTPFGSLINGVLADHFGAALTVTLGGLGCMGAAILFAAGLPRLRTEHRELIMAQRLAPEDLPN